MLRVYWIWVKKSNINAGAMGFNLQAVNTVINVDLPWNPAVLEQRISRVHRMGQKKPVQAFLLVTEKTLEEKLLGALSAKHDLAMAALDPDSTVKIVVLACGIDELKRRLKNREKNLIDWHYRSYLG